MISTSSHPNDAMFAANLGALKLWHPGFHARYSDMHIEPSLPVRVTAQGVPMPMLDVNPYHDVVAPGSEPLVTLVDFPDDLGSPLRRTVVVGFGFGYHLFALVARGKAPAVVVSDPDCFAQAMSHVDLRALFPVIELYFADALPDLPRLTEVLLHPVATSRNQPLMQTLYDRLEKHLPERTNDLEYGVYFGTYRGVTCLKNPLDLMVDQMIISLVRPTLVLEIGTLRGGSALYFNDLLRSMGGDRRIHTYDIDDHVSTQARESAGIFVHGGGHANFDPSIIRPDDRVLVIEDSSHSYRNTLEVLEKFAPHVSVGSYLIIEDTLAGLDGKRPYLEGGPIRAIEEFLPTNPEFANDPWWQDFFGPGVTNCQRGFLRRSAPTGTA